MSLSHYTEWSKMDKTELANQRMEAMKKKNEAIRKRHEEVEADRIMAEKCNSSITVVKPKADYIDQKKFQHDDPFKTKKIKIQDDWKAERQQLDKERLARVKAGYFKREWDEDKLCPDYSPTNTSSKFAPEYNRNSKEDKKKEDPEYLKNSNKAEKFVHHEIHVPDISRKDETPMPNLFSSNSKSFWSDEEEVPNTEKNNSRLVARNNRDLQRWPEDGGDVPKRSKGRGIRKMKTATNEYSNCIQFGNQRVQDSEKSVLNRQIPQNKTYTWHDHDSNVQKKHLNKQRNTYVSQIKQSSGTWSDDSPDMLEKGKNAVEKWIESLPQYSSNWSDPEDNSPAEVESAFNKTDASDTHCKLKDGRLIVKKIQVFQGEKGKSGGITKNISHSTQHIELDKEQKCDISFIETNSIVTFAAASGFNQKQKIVSGNHHGVALSQFHEKQKPVTKLVHSIFSKPDQAASKYETLTTRGNKDACRQTDTTCANLNFGNQSTKDEIKVPVNARNTSQLQRNFKEPHRPNREREDPKKEYDKRNKMIGNKNILKDNFARDNAHKYKCNNLLITDSYYTRSWNLKCYEDGKNVQWVQDTRDMKNQNRYLSGVKPFQKKESPSGDNLENFHRAKHCEPDRQNQLVVSLPSDDVWGDYEQDEMCLRKSMKCSEEINKESFSSDLHQNTETNAGWKTHSVDQDLQGIECEEILDSWLNKTYEENKYEDEWKVSSLGILPVSSLPKKVSEIVFDNNTTPLIEASMQLGGSLKSVNRNSLMETSTIKTSKRSNNKHSSKKIYTTEEIFGDQVLIYDDDDDDDDVSWVTTSGEASDAEKNVDDTSEKQYCDDFAYEEQSLEITARENVFSKREDEGNEQLQMAVEKRELENNSTNLRKDCKCPSPTLEQNKSFSDMQCSTEHDSLIGDEDLAEGNDVSMTSICMFPSSEYP